MLSLTQEIPLLKDNRWLSFFCLLLVEISLPASGDFIRFSSLLLCFFLFSLYIMCKKWIFWLKSVDYCCINKCIIRKNIRIFALYNEIRYFVLVE